MSQRAPKLHANFLSSVQIGLGFGVGTAIALSSSLGLGLAQTEPNPKPDIFETPSESTPEPSPTSTPTPGTTTTSQSRFTCKSDGGQYKVMYHPESRSGEAFPWATPSSMGGGWTPERRCNEISRRLEEYRPDGLLEMQTSIENNYNTVCVTTQRNSICRIVFTVPPGQDPMATRDQVFQNLATADSGQQTQGINTFADQQDVNWLGQIINQGLSTLGADQASTSDGINLRPFLDPADGGTGTALTQGVPVRANPQLNPNQFR